MATSLWSAVENAVMVPFDLVVAADAVAVGRPAPTVAAMASTSASMRPRRQVGVRVVAAGSRRGMGQFFRSVERLAGLLHRACSNGRAPGQGQT